MGTRAERVRPVRAVRPGDILRDELAARGWTQQELAEIMGRPLTAVNQIIVGKKQITPETASELGRALDTSPRFWLNLETAHRLAEAESTTAEAKLRAIEVRRHLRDAVPCWTELVKRGWVENTDDAAELLARVLAFFRVPDLASLQDAGCAARFRRTRDTGTDPISLLAWVRRAEQLATPPASRFARERLAAAVPGLLANAARDTGAAAVPGRLAELGMRLVLVPALPRTKVDGAVLWHAERPMVALSLRFDRLDWFWFTLLHELAHLVLEHGGDRVDTLELGAEDQQEAAANRLAKDWLIPPDEYRSLVHTLGQKPSYRQVEQLAERLGRHPSIVVGRLQWEGRLPYTHLNGTKVKVAHLLGQ